MLHGLLPHKVVVHLHAVEILAHLVRADYLATFKKLIGGTISWCAIDYFKPGAHLAAAVSAGLLQQSDTEVVFLQNHGVVVGGSCIADIEIIMQKLMTLLKNNINPLSVDRFANSSALLLQTQNYFLCNDPEVNQLATNKCLSSRLEREWVLYPDHAVFLGGQAAILERTLNTVNMDTIFDNKPPFIFYIGSGVFVSKSATSAQKVQLRCYYDVLIRQPANVKLIVLAENSISELLDWDAEKYRQIECAKL